MTAGLFAMLAAILAASHAQEALQEFVRGNQRFTTLIYKELAKTEKGSIIFSPFSAEVVLSLTNYGAVGPTSQELSRGLGLPTTEKKTEQAFKAILPSLNQSSDDLKLVSANKIYVGEKFLLKTTFQKAATEIFEAGVENVDFGAKERTANLINKWVEDRTNNKIQNLISPEQLGEAVRLVLVNTLYFKGKWRTPFDTHLTRKRPFYSLSDNPTDIDTMQSTSTYKFLHSGWLKAKFLELSYKKSNISMTFILPDDRHGLSEVEENILNYLKPQQLKNEVVSVSLPKFTITTKIDFVPILKSVGVKKLFDPAQADLSGISDEKGLFVSFVLQKAFINVTESGTEAAAATAVGVGLTAARPLEPANTFIADHPFFYYIKDANSGVILFSGKFTN